MKKIFEKYKWLGIVLGVLICAAGVVTVVLAIKNVDYIRLLVGIVLAVCCFIYGAIIIAASFITSLRTPYPIEIVFGGIIVAAGITLLQPGVLAAIENIIVYLIAFALIVIGGIALIKAVVIICYKDPVMNWLILLIGSIIAIAGGIMLLCFYNDIILAVDIVLGILIAVFGLTLLVFSIVKITKKK